MHYSLLSPIFFASLLRTLASPIISRQNIDDITIMNYALSLKHLENAFYHEALDKFDEEAFSSSGLPPWTRARFQEIADHESTHVELLTLALGKHATQPCDYNFPYTDPKSFASFSQVLEGVGVALYTGAMQYISDDAYRTAAASMLSTEARHAGWVASAVNGYGGWSNAFEVPLNLEQGYSLAGAYIVSCPSTNPELSSTTYPALMIHDPAPGRDSRVDIGDGAQATFITFLTGLEMINVPIDNGLVHIPKGLTGEIFAMATNSAQGQSRDLSMVSRPAILSFERNSRGELVSASQDN